MEIRFTKHALQRMEERGIDETEIYEVFEFPILVLEKELINMIIGHTKKNRFLTLVMDQQDNRLLTLWPSNRTQRRMHHDKAGES